MISAQMCFQPRRQQITRSRIPEVTAEVIGIQPRTYLWYSRTSNLLSSRLEAHLSRYHGHLPSLRENLSPPMQSETQCLLQPS
ncbi:hypothetical protein AHF37_10742 [Paragonimus kellicotti]|nr:hypothetical protein AHF37_10742 [Paragonimus kellicotti]